MLSGAWLICWCWTRTICKSKNSFPVNELHSGVALIGHRLHFLRSHLNLIDNSMLLADPDILDFISKRIGHHRLEEFGFSNDKEPQSKHLLIFSFIQLQKILYEGNASENHNPISACQSLGPQCTQKNSLELRTRAMVQSHFVMKLRCLLHSVSSITNQD